jgi:hypothetical protein
MKRTGTKAILVLVQRKHRRNGGMFSLWFKGLGRPTSGTSFTYYGQRLRDRLMVYDLGELISLINPGEERALWTGWPDPHMSDSPTDNLEKQSRMNGGVEAAITPGSTSCSRYSSNT